MVSESDLLTRLREILSASDLDTATAGSVRRELEKHFGADLSDRKAFIRDQIDIYLESQVVANPPEAEEDAAEEEEEAGEGSENAEQNDDVKAEDDVEEEEEPVGKARRKKAPKKVDKEGAKRGGFKTVYSLSPQLQVVVGEPEMARPEVVKKIWAYIREKDLQDPKNRRNIICDDALHAVFRVKSIDMFKMNKVLSKHIWPLNRDDEPVKKTKKVEESDHSISEGDASNVDEQEAEDEEEVVKEKGSNRKQTKKRSRSAKVDKEVKKRGGGFTKLSSLSPELQKVTGVSELARTEVVKKLWNYIRENNMQDPNNKKVIICDELFRNLFEVDSIDMFQMNKALSKHIWPLNQEAALDNNSQTEKQSGHEQEDLDEAEHDEKRQKKEIENT